MIVIVGLGNPGSEYENTPHNAGFMLLEKLRLELKEDMNLDVGVFSDEKLFESKFCKVNRDGETVALLVMPQTYMNNSGRAVKKILEKFNVETLTESLIVVHDDLDLELGKFKIQMDKSPKGHNGVNDIQSMLKRGDFRYVRIGVDDRKELDIAGDRYVLMKYSKSQLESLDSTISQAIADLRKQLQI